MKKTPMRSILSEGDVLGVDLGSHSVKVLHLRQTGRRIAVLDCAQREVWPALAGAKTEEEQRAVYAAALRELLGAKWFPVKSAAVSLPGNSVLVRFVDVTGKRRIDAATGLPEDALATIPFDASEAELDARTRPAGGAKGREEMMLVFAQKAAVAGGIAILRSAGLQPRVVINDALAAGDAYAFVKGADAKGTSVMLNIGNSTTSVSIVEDGICRAVRVLNIAGAAFTRAVRREFGVEAEAAEVLKKTYGLAGGEGEDAARVVKALRPVARDLCVEVRRTMDAFLDKRPHDHPTIETLVLSGGTADMLGLDAAMSAELGLRAEVFRPFEHAHANPALRGFDKRSSTFTVAAGLALSEALKADSPHQRFNLMPRGARRLALTDAFASRVVVGALAVAVVSAAVGLWVHEHRRMQIADDEIRFEARLAKARQDLAAQKALVQKKTAVVKPKVVVSPFAYLRSLQVTGVFGGGTFVMLSGGDRVFALRSGRLFDESEKEVPGIEARVEGDSVVLTTSRNDRYVIALPK